MQELQAVAALLVVPEYQAAVLEGLVASMGGLDASLAKAASAALVQTLTTEHQSMHLVACRQLCISSLGLYRNCRLQQYVSSDL